MKVINASLDTQQQTKQIKILPPKDITNKTPKDIYVLGTTKVCDNKELQLYLCSGVHANIIDTNTGQIIPVKDHDLPSEIQRIKTQEVCEIYFKNHFITKNELNNGDITLQSHVRGLGGGNSVGDLRDKAKENIILSPKYINRLEKALFSKNSIDAGIAAEAFCSLIVNGHKLSETAFAGLEKTSLNANELIKSNALTALNNAAVMGQELPDSTLQTLMKITNDKTSSAAITIRAMSTICEAAFAKQLLSNDRLKEIIQIAGDTSINLQTRNLASLACTYAASNGQELSKEAIEYVEQLSLIPLSINATKAATIGLFGYNSKPSEVAINGVQRALKNDNKEITKGAAAGLIIVITDHKKQLPQEILQTATELFSNSSIKETREYACLILSIAAINNEQQLPGLAVTNLLSAVKDTNDVIRECAENFSQFYEKQQSNTLTGKFKNLIFSALSIKK
ncbi:hypothetical protein Trichorick_01860 (plasmid) [Candidatus Trichorickettsia mobilis]|uniref:hypothetical protein n=1 Tax=Candidatus Trichorickettsia mobilis TaxID=1346319 RepID=UPI002B25C753|nr:hypothetical protein [Candidatus Trichorickettsia mobilis]WPY01936.1 hypothetical protein Trichorick_01860 [Candidatus Trichorickettsia mobilis]